MLEGLLTAITPSFLLALCVGTVAGIAIGALPGLTATMGTALLIPFTFALPPGEGLAMLAAVYVSAMFADAIPACLVNTPGTPSAIATALDGFPLTKKGRGQSAIAAACFSSLIGTLIGGTVFLLAMAPLSAVALQFGPPEFFWIGVFAVTIIGSLAGGSLLKGVGGGFLGMLVGAVGISHAGNEVRYTFGIPELLGGVEIVAGIIGVFAVPQVINMVAERRQNSLVAKYEPKRGVLLSTAIEVLSKPVHLLRSGLIGTAVGVLPGAGSPVAALLSYDQAKRWSRNRRQFGKGAMEGVTASETAGNAAAPASMVPLMGLGVPGSAPAAVIGGALLLHGMRPGPELVESNATLVYSFAWALLLAGFTTYIFGTILSRGLAYMINIPVRLLVPMIVMLTVIGSFALRNNLVDVYLMLILGVFCYLMTKLGFHPGPIGLGLILGPIVEPALVQSIALTESSSVVDVFLARPVSIVIIVLTLVSVVWTLWSRHSEAKVSKQETEAEQGAEHVTVQAADEDGREGTTATDGGGEPGFTGTGGDSGTAGGSGEDPAAVGHSAAPEATAWPRRQLTRGINADITSGLVFLLIGAVSFSQLGEDPQNWGYPRILTYILLAVGAGLVLQGFFSRSPGRLRFHADSDGGRADVTVFIIALIAYTVSIPYLGFWLPSFLMILGVSIYLANRRNRSAVLVSLGVTALTCIAAFLLFQHVFYVSFPEAPWIHLLR